LQCRCVAANLERRFSNGESGMKINRIALATLGGFAVLALAGCQSPESRTRSACIKNGLMWDGQQQSMPHDPASAKRVCECFARNLKANLTSAELKTVADHMSSTKPEERNQQNMPPEIATKTLGAALACAAS
jgi:hypothetical protein